MTMQFDLIAFDADDTLWLNEPRYKEAEAELQAILAPYASAEIVADYLHQTEVRNLKTVGYGVKGYLIAMLETAVAVSQQRVTGAEIEQILQVGRHMLNAPVPLFSHTEATLAELSQIKPLIIITKGDLVEQQARVARSGIAQYFQAVEIVSDKTEMAYQDLLVKYHVSPERFLMVGNSLRSDILPVVAIGGHAVYIHYEGTWQHEKTLPYALPPDAYQQIEHIGLLPDLIRNLEQQTSVHRH